jgi:flagellar motor switch protein FliN/FliY
MTDDLNVPEGDEYEEVDMDPRDLDRVLDVRIELAVELGRRRVRISEVLAMGPGSVIEFPKSADEPLDIMVNDQLVARGEAVVIGERYGVRITEVVSPNERLKSSGVVKEVPL